jgi:hypothetical protein
VSARNLGHAWKKLPKAERRKAGNPTYAALTRVCKNCGTKMGPGAGVTPTEECAVLVARQVHES